MVTITRNASFHLDSDELKFDVDIGEKVIQAQIETISSDDPRDKSAPDFNPELNAYSEHADCKFSLSEPIVGYDVQEVFEACDILVQSLLVPEELSAKHGVDMDLLEGVELTFDYKLNFILAEE